MITARKFTFGNSFDTPKVESAPAAPQPTFTQEELDAAQSAAYAEGEAAGRMAALASIEQATQQTAEQILGQLSVLFSREAAREEAMKAEAAMLARHIALKLARQVLKSWPLEEITALVGECIALNPSEPRIVVRVAEIFVDQVKALMESITSAQAFIGKVVILGDPMLAGTDCRVEWADGGAERNEQQIHQDIERIVANYVQSRRNAAKADTAIETGA